MAEDKTNKDYSKKIVVANKQYLEILRDILESEGATEDATEWQSKYSKYVVYDYEPFCSGGFDMVTTISSDSQDNLKFIEYLFRERVERIDSLNKLLTTES